MPRGTLRPSLRLEEGEDEEREERSPSNTPTATESSGRPTRLSRLIVGDLADRVVRGTRDGLEEQEGIALLGLRLTPCQWSTLRLLLAHPLLSAHDLVPSLRPQRLPVPP